eukprot:345410-Prorocentrum_minimum.AAC.3
MSRSVDAECSFGTETTKRRLPEASARCGHLEAVLERVLREGRVLHGADVEGAHELVEELLLVHDLRLLLRRRLRARRARLPRRRRAGTPPEPAAEPALALLLGLRRRLCADLLRAAKKAGGREVDCLRALSSKLTLTEEI